VDLAVLLRDYPAVVVLAVLPVPLVVRLLVVTVVAVEIMVVAVVVARVIAHLIMRGEEALEQVALYVLFGPVIHVHSQAQIQVTYDAAIY
jgi:hypothetical protein